MPMITMTISSSISVKPSLRLCMTLLLGIMWCQANQYWIDSAAGKGKAHSQPRHTTVRISRITT
jgi:hypothetical protein